MRIVWMFTLVAATGWAQGVQNMEFSWMLGGVNSASSIVAGTNGVLSGSAGFALQFGYAYQLASTKAGNIWLEVPTTYTFQGVGTVSGTTVASIDRNAWYITPGVRLKTPTYGRVSFYGSLGGGAGSLNKIESSVTAPNGTVTVNSLMNFNPALDFSGGIDLRLSRLLSVRAEGRDFVTPANLGGVSGHNHPLFLAGLAFHF